MSLAEVRRALAAPALAGRLLASRQAEIDRAALERRRATRAATRLIKEMEVPDMARCTIGVAELARAVDQVRPAAEAEAEAPRRDRPALAGILVEPRQDCIRLVATDGHRLAVTADYPDYR